MFYNDTFGNLEPNWRGHFIL